jgi:hypothetical protein
LALFRPSGFVNSGRQGFSNQELGELRMEAKTECIGYVRFLDGFPVFPINIDVGASFMADKVNVVQTVRRVLQRYLLMTTDPRDLVLDPTCGSGIRVYVAEQWAVAWMTLR